MISLRPSKFLEVVLLLTQIIFSSLVNRRVEGQSLTLASPSVQSSARQNCFAVTEVTHWNHLPTEVVIVPSIDCLRLEMAFSLCFSVLKSVNPLISYINLSQLLLMACGNHVSARIIMFVSFQNNL